MFRSIDNVKEISSKRKFESRDIVKRLGAIPPVRIHIKNHPIDVPVTVFNATAILRDDLIYVYARVILGYYMYVSAIALVRIPIHDLFNGAINTSHYAAEIVIYPSTRYDIWGTEDPRIVEINDKWYLTYTGRTVNYFNPVIRRERTLPVVAVSENRDGRYWRKVGALVLPQYLRSHLVSDKDTFVVKTNAGEILVFHRPHLDDDTYHTLISKIDRLPEARNGIEEIEVKDSVVVLEAAPFESKIGWGAPPLEVGPNKYLAILHGVDKELEAYRVFAALIKYDPADDPRVEGVTPYYIMEPRELYEVYGDRPLTIFPCGFFKYDDKGIIVYGAADYVIGFAEVDINELLGIIESSSE